MKFSTRLVALMLMSFATVAVSHAETKGELKFEGAIQQNYAQTATPVVVTTEGNVVVTGVQIKSQQLGSFVAMATKELPSSPSWKVEITGGRSIVNAIVADNNGGVFIGGNFNEKITLGDITLTGRSSVSYAKTNGFVAHIDKDGKVVSAKAICVKANPDMLSNFSDSYSDGDKVYCSLNSLAFANGKLYAGIIFTDVLESGNLSVTTGNWNLSGWGMGVGSDADLVVAELDQSNLDVAAFPVLFGGPGTYADTNYMGFNVESAQLVGDGNNLYIACTVGGYSSKGVLKVNNEQKAEASFYYAGNLNGIYLVKVDMATNAVVSKAYDGKYGWSPNTSSLVQPGVAALSVEGDNLYIGGSFYQQLPFDTNVTAVGNTDLFFASLKKDDLSLNKAVVSAYDEKTAGDDNEEKFSGFSISGGKLDIFGAVSSRQDAYSTTETISTPLQFTTDDFSTSTSLTSQTVEDYTTGVAKSGNYTYYAKLSSGQTDMYYQYTEDDGTGIQTLKQDSKKDDTVYNMQGIKLRAPQKGLNIIGGKVVLVK